MAGFINRDGKGIFSFVGQKLRSLSTLGLQYGDLVVKNSRLIGSTQAELAGTFSPGDGYDEFVHSISMSDTTFHKYQAGYDKEFPLKVKELRKFALNGEIEWILDTIADEAIVYDDSNYFAYPAIDNLELNKKYKDSLQDNFNHIYNMFMFNVDVSAWEFFRQWLIDGVLAFEIIYDDLTKPKKIIGFKELDVRKLQHSVKKDTNGEFISVWYQEDPLTRSKREVTDSQMIYISYGKSNFTGRISYAERLTRSFNLLRIIENSRVIWNVMNSQFRLKMMVPVGSKSDQKALQSLAQIMNFNKEDIFFDNDTGDLRINGQPGIPFFKNYAFPVRNGESTEIDSIAYEGPDLTDTEIIKYFHDKLKRDSKIPYERFDKDSGGGTFTIGADGINREEIRFARFIKRLRSAFQEILWKPVYIQMCLDYPELKTDTAFRSQLSIKYTEDNMFEYLKKAEIIDREIQMVESLGNLTDDGGTDPLFPKEWLAKKYLKNLTKEEWDSMEDYKKEKKEKEKKEKGSKDEESLDLGF